MNLSIVISCITHKHSYTLYNTKRSYTSYNIEELIIANMSEGITSVTFNYLKLPHRLWG